MKKNLFLLMLLTTLFSCVSISINKPKQNVETHKIFNKFGEVKYDEFIEELSDYDVIFFGEYSNSPFLRQFKKKMLSSLDNKSNFSLSFEMLERDTQQFVDDYLGNRISEEEFEIQAKVPKNYLTDYKPIIDFAKQNNMDIIAANIPKRYSRMVHQKGSQSLKLIPPNEQKFVPKNPKVFNNEYKNNYIKLMALSMGLGNKIPDRALDLINKMYQSLCIQDDTMAESILQYLETHPNKKVIHFNVDFRSNYNLGTVQKLKLLNNNLKIAVISPSEIPFKIDLHVPKSKKNMGDYIVAYRQNSVIDLEEKIIKEEKLAPLTIIDHDIQLNFDSDANIIYGEDKVTFNRKLTAKDIIKLNGDLKITKISADNLELKYIHKKRDYHNIQVFTKKETTEILIEYEGKLSKNNSTELYLSQNSYHPFVDNSTSKFKINAICSNDISLIGTNKAIITALDNEKHQFTWSPKTELNSMAIVGNKYHIQKIDFDNITFSTYLLSDENSSKKYLNALIDYYKIYKDLLGEFPYNTFNIVENNSTPVSEFPSFTALSTEQINNPDQVLKPEILLHSFISNWWGNGVFVDNKFGDWAIPLTSFCADFYWLNLFHEREARNWRKDISKQLSLLPRNKLYSLKDYSGQDDKIGKLIGHKMGAYMFYEIFELMGKDDFFYVLDSFFKSYKGKKATWEDVQLFFSMKETESQKEIIYNYLNNNELLDISLESISVFTDTLTFEIHQKSSPRKLHIPIEITTNNRTITDTIFIDSSINKFYYKIQGEILKLQIDPLNKILKRMSIEQMPYSLRKTLSSNPLVILPLKGKQSSKIQELGSKLLKKYPEGNFTFDKNTEKNSNWSSRNLLVIGSVKNNSFYSKILRTLPKDFSIDRNVFSFKNKQYAADNDVLFLSYKSHNQLITLLIWNSDETIPTINELENYLDSSYYIIDKKTDKIIESDLIMPKDSIPLIWESK